MKPAFGYLLVMILIVFSIKKTTAQNPLFIPPTMSGTDFQLNVQSGTVSFWNGINTPTYGVNGNFLGPTLIFNKGEVVNLHITNNLTTATTMHWHGLHIPAKYDGGPHQSIDPGTTWDVSYEVMNDAGTFWYHPHGKGKTDLQVSKGIAGLILVKDDIEAALELPRTYGTDDFPLIVQSKAFDVLNQIAIATELDTLVLVNGTKNPSLDAPAQVVRFRILNGSSMRSYDFGFTNNMQFYQIGSDGGLLAAPVALTRLRLAPGERAEILLDFGAIQGQTVYFRNFGSDLPDGIYGAADVGNGMVSIPDYNLNPLNGADYNLLQINIIPPTSNPVTTIPLSLVPITPLIESDASLTRTLTFAPQDMMPMSEMVEGPFEINGVQFAMETINVTTYLNTTEIWKLTNQTLIAHPFHIHDVQFFILDENGIAPPPNEQGKKDVVLVMPMQTVRVIMKFEDFADDSVPYMYHCHMLHHEDDGMMGSFVVLDTSSVGINPADDAGLNIFPNPANQYLNVGFPFLEGKDLQIYVMDILGKEINVPVTFDPQTLRFDVAGLSKGIYFIHITEAEKNYTIKFIKG